MQNVLGHCIRNSISHAAKVTKIRLTVLQNQHQFIVVHYQDDGDGLDLNRIMHKAIAQNLIGTKAGDEEIAQMIFQPDFSTKDEADEISGRGIGMDAIRSLLAREQGTIHLKFLTDRDLAGFRKFELIIYIPN